MGYLLDDFLGNNPDVVWIRKHLPQMAKSAIPILIYGETGSGKTMLAEIIHSLSPRGNRPYVHLDCGGMVEDLVANELFGHMRGSFTSADRTQMGLIERANTGTLFLDELGNLTFEAQTKLLQVLDENRFRRVGGVEEVNVDVRIIGASCLPLRHYVNEGKLRKDLYYRLKGIRLTLPPLRERREDILLLINHYLSRFSRQLNRKVPRITHEAREILVNYPWPGNVREIKRLTEEIASLHQVEYITPADLHYLDVEAIHCWEVEHCDQRHCVAYGAHDHRCWLMENTLCGDGIPRKLSQKVHTCLDCEVFVRNCFLVGSTGDGARAEFLRNQVRLWSTDASLRNGKEYSHRLDNVSLKEFRQRVMHTSMREYFAALLRKHNGNVDRVAEQSGLSKSSVYQLLRKHRLTVEEFRKAPKSRHI